MTARKAIALVAWREIHDRLRSRAFLASTLFMLLLVGVAIGLGSLLPSTTTYRLAVTAPVPGGLEAALQRAAKPFDAKVRLQVVDSAAAGREQLDAEKVDALLVLRHDRVLFRTTVDAKLAAIADTAVRSVRNHLPPRPELAAATLRPVAKKTSEAATAIAFAAAALLFTTIALYGQWVLTGVVEEKANRVVELVLSSVRARDLLVGKVIGIGLLGLAQVALVGGLAAVLIAAGVLDAPASLGGDLALVIPWFALGFALYAVVYAAAGALASRQQDATSAGTAVTYSLVAAFFLGYAALASDKNGVLANVLTVLPLTALLVLPARSALVGVPLWEHALAVVLVLASIYWLLQVAGGIYAEGLLRSGPRIGVRAAWRLSHERG